MRVFRGVAEAAEDVLAEMPERGEDAERMEEGELAADPFASDTRRGGERDKGVTDADAREAEDEEAALLLLPPPLPLCRPLASFLRTAEGGAGSLVASPSASIPSLAARRAATADAAAMPPPSASSSSERFADELPSAPLTLRLLEDSPPPLRPSPS